MSLVTLIEQSILLNPKGGHHDLLLFLQSSGLRESELEQFKEAWSRAHLTNTSFGKKVDNPQSFAQDVLKELCANSESAKNASNITIALEDIIRNSGQGNVHESFSKVVDMGACIHAAVNSAFSSSEIENLRPELNLFDSMAILRNGLRGAKFRWQHSAHGVQNVSFVPVDVSLLGDPAIIQGELLLKDSNNALHPADFLSSNHIVGVRVSSRQPLFQTRAWDTYEAMTLFFSPNLPSAFPLPLKAHMEVGGSLLVVFERSVDINPIASFSKAALSVFLHKIPSCIVTWCNQLGQTYFKLLENSYSLVKIPTLLDCYVRGSGALLVGNQVFSSSNASPETHSRSLQIFIKFAVDLLSEVLCLSRKVTYVFPEDGTNTSEDNISLVAGSSLEIHIGGSVKGQLVHLVNRVKSRTNANSDVSESEGEPSTGSVLVMVEGDAGVATVASFGAQSGGGATGDSTNSGLFLTSLHPGFVDFFITSSLDSSSSSGEAAELVTSHSENSTRVPPASSSSYGRDMKDFDESGSSFLEGMHGEFTGVPARRGRSLRVTVLPRVVSPSLDVQELIALLEMSYLLQNPRLLLQAHCFRSQESWDEISVMSDWVKIKTSIRGYG